MISAKLDPRPGGGIGGPQGVRGRTPRDRRASCGGGNGQRGVDRDPCAEKRLFLGPTTLPWDRHRGTAGNPWGTLPGTERGYTPTEPGPRNRVRSLLQCPAPDGRPSPAAATSAGLGTRTNPGPAQASQYGLGVETVKNCRFWPPFRSTQAAFIRRELWLRASYTRCERRRPRVEHGGAAVHLPTPLQPRPTGPFSPAPRRSKTPCPPSVL